MRHLNNFGIRQIHNNRQRNCFFLQAVNNPDGLIVISVSKKNNFEIRGTVRICTVRTSLYLQMKMFQCRYEGFSLDSHYSSLNKWLSGNWINGRVHHLLMRICRC